MCFRFCYVCDGSYSAYLKSEGTRDIVLLSIKGEQFQVGCSLGSDSFALPYL